MPAGDPRCGRQADASSRAREHQKFKILGSNLSQEAGDLTADFLKVKRKQVSEKYRRSSTRSTSRKILDTSRLTE